MIERTAETFFRIFLVLVLSCSLFVLLNGQDCVTCDNGEDLIEVGQVTFQEGETTCVPISANCWDSIASFNFSVNFESEYLEFETIIFPGIVPGLDNSGVVNITPDKPNTIRVLWGHPNINDFVSLADGTVIMEVCFKTIQYKEEPINIIINVAGQLGVIELVHIDRGAIRPCITAEANDVLPQQEEFPEIIVNSCDASNGTNNGSIELFVYNGDPPYTLADNNGNNIPLDGNNSALLNSLATGTYQFTATDADGDQSSIAIVNIVNQASPITIDILRSRNPTCFDEDNGIIELDINGGLPFSDGSYQINWTGELIQIGDQTIRNLIPGPYNVEVTDSLGCSVFENFDLSVDEITLQSEVLIAPTCDGRDNGQLRVTAQGGTPNANGYTFDLYREENGVFGFYRNFTSPDNPVTFSTLPSGNYRVEAMDSIGGRFCVGVLDVFLQGGRELSVNLDQNSSVCVETGVLLDISGDVTATDGINSFPFAVSLLDQSTTPPGVLTTLTLNDTSFLFPNLPAGNYSVDVRDGSGCRASSALIITQGDSLVFQSEQITNSCDGSSAGSIAIQVGSRTTPTYLWSNGETTTQIDNLAAGTYDVTISNASCSIGPFSFEVMNETPFEVNASIIDPFCAASDGSISLDVTPIADPYSFTWDVANDPQIAMLSAAQGTYDVTITNGNSGCQLDTFFTLVDPPGLSVSLTPGGNNPPECPDGTNGFAVAQGNGGTSSIGYRYHWSSGEVLQNGATSTSTFLSAGMNWVFIEDDNACRSDTFFFVTPSRDPLEIDSATSIITSPNCFGEPNGSAVIAGMGGAGSLTYSWFDLGISGPSISGVPAGDYSLRITDALGCSNLVTVTVPEPDNLLLEIDSMRSSFGGCSTTSAIVALNGTGGTGAISYNWSPNVSQSDMADLVNGMYTVVASDDNGCLSNVLDFTISSPPPLQIDQLLISAPSCIGELGFIQILAVSGGAANAIYSYQLNANILQPIDSVSSVPPGNYNISVFDNTGCFVDTTITIDQAQDFTVDIPDNITVSLGESANILAQFSGGDGISEVFWNSDDVVFCNNDLCSNVMITPVRNTTVEVVGIDNNGCISSDEVFIQVLEGVDDVLVANALSPNSRGFNDMIQLVTNESVAAITFFKVFDRWGQEVFVLSNVLPDPRGIDAWNGFLGNEPTKPLVPGVYVYVMQYEKINGDVRTQSGDITLIK